ncbi:MAG TPA: catecholate siderophore receptor Fiu [Rhodanobacteraceae bacterium]|nr:catecholate siderophore receptor Fiu [Rhodanobacteraceae bacterium]
MSFIKSRKHPVNRVNHARSNSALTASIVTALALGIPATAMAGNGNADTATTPGIEQAKTLSTVKVTATSGPDYRGQPVSPKFTQPVIDIPQTLQIITDDLFDQQGATTLAQALRNSPGVGTFYVGENGATSTGDAIRMRGFDTSGSIFVDGVRDMGSISRDVFNIEQVEVTKGPDGTEYGRTAPTGAVNMVTKQPFLAREVSASVSYGSAQQKRATADWNQPLGEHSALRLNVMGQNSGVPGRDVVENDRWGVAPSLAFGLGTPTRVFIDYLHIRQNNIPDGGVPTIGLPGYSSPDPARPQIGQAPMVDASNFYGTRQDHDDVLSDMFTVRVEHDFGGSTVVRNTTRWGRTRQDYLLTSWRGKAENIVTPDLADPTTWTITRDIPTFKHEQNGIITNQTNLRTSLVTGGIEHDISSGIELTRESVHTVDIDALDGSIWPAANLYRPDHHVGGLAYGPDGAWSKGHTDTYAAYLFDTLKFGERWQASAGLRMDHYRTAFQSTALCGASRRSPDCAIGQAEGTPVTAIDTTVSDNLFNWKLGVLYKPTEGGSIYANYVVSAEPPGGETLALSWRADSADNPDFDPQKAHTIEFGTKWNLFSERLLLSAAVYRTTVTNQVEQDPVDLQYYQTGEKRVEGVEITAVGHITDRWAVNLGVTTMDAKVTNGEAVANDGSSNLAYTPSSAFTAWTTYTLPFKLVIGGGARYNGSMKRGHDGAIGTPEYVRPYWVFNLMASYPVNRHLELQLNINNVFDNDYVAAINKSGYRYTPGAPRSAMLTANIRF